jgi:hypothetical protein
LHLAKYLRVGVIAQWQSACLAYVKSSGQSWALQKKKFMLTLNVVVALCIIGSNKIFVVLEKFKFHKYFYFAQCLIIYFIIKAYNSSVHSHFCH